MTPDTGKGAGKRNTYFLLVGMWTGTDPMDISIKVSQREENRSTTRLSCTILRCIHEGFSILLHRYFIHVYCCHALDNQKLLRIKMPIT